MLDSYGAAGRTVTSNCATIAGLEDKSSDTNRVVTVMVEKKGVVLINLIAILNDHQNQKMLNGVLGFWGFGVMSVGLFW